MGSVTITRANVIVAQPAVGDLVYEGDLIETGIDGLVSIVFVDGTTFRLYDNAHVVLDEFVFAPERLSNSALFRVLKGRFSFLSGLVATTGRLMIDTAVARIQNSRPAAGIGGLAFSVFTIGLIHELNAASADIALLDDGTITCKDLKHGVFEIITKGDHPQRFVVDDPCVSIHFQIVGSQIRVSEVANTPGQMALFHEAYLGTLDSFLRGQQDALIQKWEHAELQSTSPVGSSSQLNGLNNVTLLVNENGGTFSTGNGATNTTATTTTVAVALPLLVPPPPSNIVIWASSSSGAWETGPDWNVGTAPAALDTAEINVPPGATPPLTVYINTSETVGSLLVGPGVILDIESGGSLTISNGSISIAATSMVETTGSGSLTIDPSSINNSGLLEANGATIDLTDDIVTNSGELLATAGGTLVLSGDTVTNSTTTAIVEVDASSKIDLASATISGGIVTVNGLLDSTGNSAIDGAAITIASTGTLEATSGMLTIDLGSISNAGTLEANGAQLDLVSLTVSNTGTVEATGAAGLIDLQSATIDGGTVSTGSGDVIEATVGTSTIESTASFDNAGTLEADGAQLDLVSLTVSNTGTVEATGTAGLIDLQSATISGGTVDTGADGVIEATSGTNTIENVITFTNAGLLEAIDGATLVLSGETVTNDGQITAGGSSSEVIFEGAVTNDADGTMKVDSGGTFDVKTESISNTNTTDGIEVDGTFKVDVGAGNTLELTGAGELRLAGGTITGVAGSEILDNDGNTIDGYGLIENLVLQNGDGPGGTIDANSSGNTLIINTGGNSIVNESAGTLEATLGGILDVQSPLNNSGLIASRGSELDVTGPSISWNGGTPKAGSNGILLAGTGDTLLVAASGGTLTLNGSTANGAVSLGAGTQIIANTAEVLDNFNNDITGDGSIGNGNKDLTLNNQAAGIIDANVATETLTIDTGNTVTNAGLLEGSAGSNLQIDDNVVNNGIIEALAVTGAPIKEVDVAGNITGTGLIDIFSHAKLEIDGTVSTGQTVIFEVSNGDAELILDDPHGFQGLIKGLVESSPENTENYIDLEGFSYTAETKVVSASYNPTTNITAVTITNGNSANNITLNLSGDYQKGDIEFASDGSGGTLFSDPQANSGTVTIGSGTTLDIAAASTATVSFTNSNGNTGELVLGHASDFSGQISGFTGTAPDTAHSDAIDLAGFNYASTTFSETSSNGNLVLTATDGSEVAKLTFFNFDGTLSFASDGNGGTLITDPPVTAGGGVGGSFGRHFTHDSDQNAFASDGQDAAWNKSAFVSFGGPGNGNFIFHPSLGADTGRFDPLAAATEFGQPEGQHWASLIKGDAIEFVPIGDAIMPLDLDATHWHLTLHNAFHLH